MPEHFLQHRLEHAAGVGLSTGDARQQTIVALDDCALGAGHDFGQASDIGEGVHHRGKGLVEGAWHGGCGLGETPTGIREGGNELGLRIAIGEHVDQGMEHRGIGLGEEAVGIRGETVEPGGFAETAARRFGGYQAVALERLELVAYGVV